MFLSSSWNPVPLSFPFSCNSFESKQSQCHSFLHCLWLMKWSSFPIIKCFIKHLLLPSIFPWVGSSSLNHFNKTFDSTQVKSDGVLPFSKSFFAALVRAMPSALTFLSLSNVLICSFLTGSSAARNMSLDIKCTHDGSCNSDPLGNWHLLCHICPNINI